MDNALTKDLLLLRLVAALEYKEMLCVRVVSMTEGGESEIVQSGISALIVIMYGSYATHFGPRQKEA